jgi:2-deoxy-D-gluconate 3-dehydrogenase
MDESMKSFSLKSFSLEGKVAIVTGANMGLGMAYAYAFAKAGADLFIPHFTDDVSEIRALIESEGRRVEFLQGDLTKSEYIDSVVQGCMVAYGQIDILVNNAGASYFADFADYPDSAWQRIIDLDLNAVYYLSHRVAKEMVRQGSGKSLMLDRHCRLPPTRSARLIRQVSTRYLG